MAITDYSAKVTEHFLHPKKLGLLTAADVDPKTERLLVGDAGQVSRGDALRITLRLRLSDERILDARFQNFGTGMPIAGASCFCLMAENKTLDEALRITALDLDRELEGLPELKLRKPVLVLDALDNAVRKYRGKPPREKSAPGEPPICFCFQVSENSIERAIRLRGLRNLAEVIDSTKAGGGCHTCHPDLEKILERCARKEYRVHIPLEDYAAAQTLFGVAVPSAEELAKNPPAPPDRSARQAPDGFIYPDKSPVAAVVSARKAAQKSPAKLWNEMSAAERLARLEEALEYDLRPAIKADGGDIKLVGLDDNRVRVTLHGHCRSCHSALSTLKMGVEKHLREAVWPELEVEEVVEGY